MKSETVEVKKLSSKRYRSHNKMIQAQKYLKKVTGPSLV